MEGTSSNVRAYDVSTVNVDGGSLSSLYVNNSSTLEMSSGNLGSLWTYDNTDIKLSGGSISGSIRTYGFSKVDVFGDFRLGSIFARENSKVNIFDVNQLDANHSIYITLYDNVIMNIFNSLVNNIAAHGNNIITISDSIMDLASADNDSTLLITGYSRINYLEAYNFANIIINGYDFVLGDGLWLYDNVEIMGTGLLVGKSFTQGRIVLNITNNPTTAVIMLTSEPFNPEPHCGDENHPFPLGDLNGDCRVDLADLAIVATNWLKCTAPDCN